MKRDQKTPENSNSLTPVTSSIPDEEKRLLLKRLGVAAVTIPIVTVLHDVTKNVAAAS